MLCKICGANNSEVKYYLKIFNVVKCCACSTVFLDFKNKVMDPREVYSANYYQERNEHYLKNIVADPIHGPENPSVIDFREGIKLIESFKHPSRLLDIGCGMGIFLAMARERGWEVSGVDISDYAIKFAMERFGIDCFAGYLKDANLPDRYFDVITLWDVLEHFENPLEELKEVKRILNDDGIIIFDTPNVDSLMRLFAHWTYKITGGLLKYPVKKLYHQFHLYYFSPKTLRMLLDKAGFEIIEMRKKTIPITKAKGNRLEKLIVKGLSLLEKAMNREYELFVVVKKARTPC
jgi:2-polyprenyl-3-methyl-5-hydroxy-6-metoxy-1,4-benzoquinol methylase